MSKLRCRCPGCQKLLQIEADRTRDLRVNCPQCQRAFTIPAAEREVVAASLVDPVRHQDDPLDNLFAHLPPAQRDAGRHTNSASVGYGSGPASTTFSYAPPRARKKLSAKAKKQIVLSVSLGGGAIALLMVGLFVAVPLLKQMGAGQLVPSPAGGMSSLLSLDSREAVLRDLQSECDRLEAIGRAIPKGDQSKEAAQPLLDGRLKLIEMLRRACRLKSVRAELSDAAPGGNGGLPPQPQVANADPNTWFWRIDTSRAPDDHVTDAINQLSSLKYDVQAVASFGVLELPSPLEAKAEEYPWTDEERRVLSALHLQGRFLRDFAHALAYIDPDAVNAESLQTLHDVMDQYSKAARELVETSRQMLEKAGLPSQRMIIQEPKRTPYHLQKGMMSATFSGLKSLYADSREDDPHFDFVMEEADRLSQDIADIMFGADRHAVFVSEQSSLERYQAFAAKKQAEADRLAELEAEKVREAEEQKRLAEQRRREEEARREEAKANETPSSLAPFAGRPPANRPTSPSPSDFSSPSGRRAPRTFVPPRVARGPETQPNHREPALPPRTSAPSQPQSTITIEIRSESSFDSNTMVRQLSQKLEVRNYSSSQSNNQATWRFTDDGNLERYVDAIDFGTVTSVDENSRTIHVTIP